MRERERVERKSCPQCGWDAEGRPVEAEEPRSKEQKTRYEPRPKHDFDCGNCGYQWTE